MLTEDQMFADKDIQDTKIKAHENMWHIAGPEVTRIHMFANKANKEKWEEERKARLEKYSSSRKEARSLETIALEEILNNSQSLDDIQTNLKILMERMAKVDWEKLLEIRQQLLDEHWQEKMECSECKGSFPRTQLYEIGNRRPVKDDSFYSERRYCSSCLDKMYELIFPLCVVCGCRHEVNTLIDDRDFCDNCRSDKFMFERSRIRKHIERAKSCGALMSLTIKQWLTTLDHFEWACAYCKGSYHALEHYNPLPLGGTTANNCVPSCHQCNMRKRDRTPESFDKLFSAENLARIRAWLAIQEA